MLRTTSLRIDPRPKRHHKGQGLKRNDGSLRAWYRWDRRAHMVTKGLYRKGPWAATHGFVNVDTSGHAFGKDEDAWKWYKDRRQLQGEEMDIEMEMGIFSDKEYSSDVEKGGREKVSSPPSPRPFFRESTPFSSDALSDIAEDTQALSAKVQQLPEEGSDARSGAQLETNAAVELPVASDVTGTVQVRGLAAVMKEFYQAPTPE
jgi:hypothetical protein